MDNNLKIEIVTSFYITKNKDRMNELVELLRGVAEEVNKKETKVVSTGPNTRPWWSPLLTEVEHEQKNTHRNSASRNKIH